MAENSAIEWTTHTFNPWRGCTKVSAGCANCYAEVDYSVKIRGVKWGPQGNRIVKAESGWKEPLKWDRLAKAAGERHRVFCASLADIFEDWQGPMLDSSGIKIWKRWDHTDTNSSEERPGPRWSPLTMQDVRNRLFRLIDATPNLDWLLLTKRPENIAKMMPPTGIGDFHERDEVCTISLEPRHNLWLGVSVENQQAADERIPKLLKVPAAVRFLSCEPLLGPVDLEPYMQYPPFHENYKLTFGVKDWRGVDWVIVGGESGPKARPCNVAWIRSIVEQCKAAGTACFVKQIGKVWIIQHEAGNSRADALVKKYGVNLIEEHYFAHDKKGGDMEEWPSDLRVREFPSDRN